jgi:hypothetical protein
MKIQPILAFAAAMALSFAAHAHDCSGGAAGGMDATGNQCSDESAYSQTSVAGAPAASPAAQLGARSASVATFKPVATNADKASQHASKKNSHRAAKKPIATAG